MPSKGPWCFCTKCLEFGWRLSHDLGFCCMFEPQRCWLEIFWMFCRGCPLPRLHYIEFLMKQKKVTRARRALDRACSLTLPIGMFCVQLRCNTMPLWNKSNLWIRFRPCALCRLHSTREFGYAAVTLSNIYIYSSLGTMYSFLSHLTGKSSTCVKFIAESTLLWTPSSSLELVCES